MKTLGVFLIVGMILIGLVSCVMYVINYFDNARPNNLNKELKGLNFNDKIIVKYKYRNQEVNFLGYIDNRYLSIKTSNGIKDVINKENYIKKV